MCGILGVTGQNIKEDKERFDGALDLLFHRGSDEKGSFYGENFIFGSQRLKIIDFKDGQQPLSNENRDLEIVFNGEIYNYLRLRGDLETKGYRFKSNTDTEVILHLYEEEGIECLGHLEGMFAFAIYDKRRKICFLSRDRFGIKPLFYWTDKEKLIFSSEIKPILKILGRKPAVSIEALNLYFWLDYVPSPYTIYQGVQSLLPSHYLVFSNQGVKRNKYYNLEINEFKKTTIKEAVVSVRSVLGESVKRHLVSDTEVGLLLSGGIDSSILAYEMSRNLNEFKTFNMGFKNSGYDESKYADIVSKQFNSEHKSKEFPSLESMRDLEKIVSCMEQPFADHSVIPTYLISEFSSDYLKVVLAGDGGDEVFLGYQTYIAHKLFNWFQFIPRNLRREILKAILVFLPKSDRYFSLDFCLGRLLRSQSRQDIKRHIHWMESFGEERKVLLGSAYRNIEEQYLNFTESTFITTDNLMGRIQQFDIFTYLSNDILYKSDFAGMMNSQEVRVPYLDHKVVELGLSLPYEFKLKGLRGTKYVLKRAYRDVLPRSVLMRKKMGFSLPTASLFRKELKSLMLSFIEDKNMGDYLNVDYIKKIFNEHLRHESNNRKMLWNILIFFLWYKNNETK
ncbi:MAG: asparagine synthase (glutamine-hydrolyzing) [Candidatus Saelkia tenebricola]|nr:asparagine synthase (glutamine-hydrolyzing) [Candidatus Saelkia tenebricola]